ncbi:MAG: FtsQ-type POTRA domain-containing protein [Clostridia bacterium]|nr:FtsQ-type POTRA domain-containing protein [Clostridia bacterium]
MKLKKVSTILIAVVFMVIVIISFIGLFSVKKVHVDFTVSTTADIERVQNKLDKFLGANLLVFNEQEVSLALADEPYFEVVSVEKSYPNVLSVDIKERVEVYYIEYQGEFYIMTEDGFVLTKTTENPSSRYKIYLKLDGVNVNSLAVGSYIDTDKNEFVRTAFEMAGQESVNLTDCIKTLTVFVRGSESPDVIFETYTGVSIEISYADDDGVEKTQEAFESYYKHSNDYEKTFSHIIANKVDGKIDVRWSEPPRGE